MTLDKLKLPLSSPYAMEILTTLAHSGVAVKITRQSPSNSGQLLQVLDKHKLMLLLLTH